MLTLSQLDTQPQPHSPTPTQPSSYAPTQSEGWKSITRERALDARRRLRATRRSAASSTTTPTPTYSSSSSSAATRSTPPRNDRTATSLLATTATPPHASRAGRGGGKEDGKEDEKVIAARQSLRASRLRKVRKEEEAFQSALLSSARVKNKALDEMMARGERERAAAEEGRRSKVRLRSQRRGERRAREEAERVERRKSRPLGVAGKLKHDRRVFLRTDQNSPIAVSYRRRVLGDASPAGIDASDNALYFPHRRHPQQQRHHPQQQRRHPQQQRHQESYQQQSHRQSYQRRSNDVRAGGGSIDPLFGLLSSDSDSDCKDDDVLETALSLRHSSHARSSRRRSQASSQRPLAHSFRNPVKDPKHASSILDPIIDARRSAAAARNHRLAASLDLL